MGLSMQEVFGPREVEAPAAKPVAGGIPHNELFSGADPINKAAMEQKSFWGQTKSVAKDLAGYGLGTIGQIEDMFLAIPRVLSIPETTGIALRGAAAGESSKDISAAMLKSQEEFMPAWTQGVFGKIAESLGADAKNYYDNNGLGRFMQMFGEKAQQLAEKGEDFGLPKELTTVAINNAMDIFGAKGVKEGVKAGVRKRGAMEEARQSEAFAERNKPVPVEEVVPQVEEVLPQLTKKEQKAWAATQSEAIKDVTISSPEQVKAIFDEALRTPDDAGMVVNKRQLKGIFEGDAKVAEAAPEAFPPGEVPKTRMTEGLPLDEAKTAAVLTKLREEPWNMTAAEKVAARGALKVNEGGQLVDAQGRPFLQRGGSQDLSTFIHSMNALSVGTAAAIALYKYFIKEPPKEPVDEEQELGRGLRDKFIKEEREKIWLEDRIKGKKYPIMAGAGGAAAGLMSASDVGALATGLAGGMLGAVRVKGSGVWTKGAIDKIADPLAMTAARRTPENIASAREGKLVPEQVWANKAVTNHLNRYFGSAEDPLAGVKIPMLGDEVTWGQVADAVVKSAKIPERLKMMKEGKALPGEAMWDVETGNQARGRYNLEGDVKAHNSFNALTSYLSHVGDYLRQNVPPEKLANYDLVKAVKETAAADARVAEAAAREAAGDSVGMPVYKTYKDKFQWLELKEPKELTPAQEARIRPATEAELDKRVEGSRAPTLRERGATMVALDSEGKPIINRFTEQIAGGPDKTKTHLAGLLAKEGNAVQHCVGGYYDQVWNGESKIYSLRDAKGMSHVTVEVSPNDLHRINESTVIKTFGQAGKEVIGSYKQSGQRSTLGGYLQQYAPEMFERLQAETPNDILQIKGKQNRAPVDAYLPYVQDFVKSGKWGDVGDLVNAGMRPISEIGGPHVQSLAKIRFPGEKYLTIAQEKLLAEEIHGARDKQGKLIPDKESDGVPEGPADVGMGIDAVKWAKQNPELAKKVAVVGAGAAAGMALSKLVDPEHPLRDGIYGALAGAAFGTPGGHALVKRIVSSPDEAVGLLSTRLGNIAPELKYALRRHEGRVLKIIDQLNDQVLPFLQALNGLPDAAMGVAKRALLNGDVRMLGTIPELKATYPAVAKALSGLEGQLQSLGRFAEGVSNYFPRIVRDFEGLKKAIGQQATQGLEAMLVKAEAKSIRQHGRGLSDVEQSIIVNRYLFSQDKSSFQPGYAKTRRLGEVPEELAQFYEAPQESLLRYLSGAVNDIETARFFGRDLTQSKIGKKMYTDLDGSIGNLTARLLREGKIKQPQAMQIRDMLKARFQGGEQGMSAPLAATRNLTNTALLGNIASAATQVGDSLMVVAHHDLVPAVQSLYETVRGKSQIKPKDLGLINHVAEELSELGWTGRALHTTMKLAGFHAVDMFGKKLNMNAALIKNARLVRSPKGEAEFRAKYEPAFGEQTGRVIEDLKARRMSPEVEELAFNELSDSQPISKAELPQMYLEHPNGRILYQLKTYMMKQADVVRREVVQEMASGEPRRIAKGAKKLMILGSMYALANVPGDVIKDWIEGRNSDPLSTPRLVENLLQTFGINRYSGERLMKGNVVGAVQDLVTPPVRVLQDIAQGSEKTVSYVPIAGRSFYNRYLGGNEKREISEVRSANRGKMPSERERLSPAARDYLREKNREAQQKRRDAR